MIPLIYEVAYSMPVLLADGQVCQQITVKVRWPSPVGMEAIFPLIPAPRPGWKRVRQDLSLSITRTEIHAIMDDVEQWQEANPTPDHVCGG